MRIGRLLGLAALTFVLVAGSFEAVLAATQTITITNADNQPAANVLVNAYIGGRQETFKQTNASGTASFSLAAGVHELKYAASGTNGKEVSLGFLTVESSGGISDFTPSNDTDITKQTGSAVTLRAKDLKAGATSTEAKESSGKATPSPGSTTVSKNGAPSSGGKDQTVALGQKLPAVAKADCTATKLEAGVFFGKCLNQYIQNLYEWALVIGAGLAVLMVMWAGYSYVMSAGDPEAVRSAKEYLWGAVLGLLLLILTYTIYNTLRLAAPGDTFTAPTTTPGISPSGTIENDSLETNPPKTPPVLPTPAAS